MEERNGLWNKWLWKTNLCCKYLPEIGFNEHHLIALLLARDEANAGYSAAEPTHADDLEHLPDEFLLRMEVPFAELPTTMLMDTMDMLQCSWAKVLYNEASAETWRETELFVHMLFRRTGELIGHTDVDDKIFNHIQTTEVLANGRVGMTQTGVRQLLDIFVVLFRHLDLYHRRQAVQITDELASAVEKLRKETFRPHALEATRDNFYKISTYYDLPTGARLAYMHRFSGMYNCVSQVAYFHNESYARRVPPKCSDMITLAIEELPLLEHMHPNVPVIFEDECPRPMQAYWMLLSGCIYMVREDGTPLYDELASTMFVARHVQ